MFKRIVEAIARKFALDAVTRTARATAKGITALNHESRNDAVKDYTVIKTAVS